jgi:hypothetical protein
MPELQAEAEQQFQVELNKLEVQAQEEFETALKDLEE